MEKRQNVLTEDDLKKIGEIFAGERSLPDHRCRFPGVTPEELAKMVALSPDDIKEMIDTHKQLVVIVQDSKTVIRRTLLGILVVVFVGLVSKGFWTKLMEMAAK